MYTIARVWRLPGQHPALSGQPGGPEGGLWNWRDEEKLRWLDPDSETARAYIVGLCRELAQLGFDEIMLDQCWFPTRASWTRS